MASRSSKKSCNQKRKAAAAPSPFFIPSDKKVNKEVPGAAEVDDIKERDPRALFDSAVKQVTQVYGQHDEKQPVDGDQLDHREAVAARSSLCFGEVLPAGVDKILDANHLDATNAKVFYDLGSGNGKLAMQAFLQFPNLQEVVGVELAITRSIRGMAATQRLGEESNKKYEVTCYNDVEGKKKVKACRSSVDDMMALRNTRLTETIGVGQKASKRIFELRRQNMFEVIGALQADIIICETRIIESMHAEFVTFICKMKPGARLLTYEPLRSVFRSAGVGDMPFTEIQPGDHYDVSWCVRGQNFYLWRRN